MSEKQSISVKIVIIGEPAVGKTTLRESFVGAGMQGDYLMTLGVDMAQAQIEIDNNLSLDAQIWDIAGQDSLETITNQFLAGTQGAIFVFDLTREYTFEKINSWLDRLHGENPELENNIPFLIVGNKSDLEVHIKTDDADVINYIEYVDRHHVYSKTPTEYIKTSAKTGLKVKEAFKRMGEIIVKNFHEINGNASLDVDIEKLSKPEETVTPTVVVEEKTDTIPISSTPIVKPKPVKVETLDLMNIPTPNSPSEQEVETLPVETPTPKPIEPPVSREIPAPTPLPTSKPDPVRIDPPRTKPKDAPAARNIPAPTPMSISNQETSQAPDPVQVETTESKPVEITPPWRIPTPASTDPPEPVRVETSESKPVETTPPWRIPTPASADPTDTVRVRPQEADPVVKKTPETRVTQSPTSPPVRPEPKSKLAGRELKPPKRDDPDKIRGVSPFAKKSSRGGLSDDDIAELIRQKNERKKKFFSKS